MAKPLDKMGQARGRLLIGHPFFASLVMSVPHVITTEVARAATDSKRQYYNPHFISETSIPALMGTMAHESLHDALFHVVRRFSRNHRIWNMACDYPVNHTVLECRLELPDDVLIDKVLGLNSADVNYELLMKKSEENRKQRRSERREPQDGQPGQPSGGGSGDPDDGLPEDALGQDIRDVAMGDPAEQAKVEQEVRHRVAQAASIARMAGKLPGGLERLINAILNPQVPWHDVLREFMTAICKSTESWSKRNRRFSGVYLPSRFSEAMGPVGLIGDTSGSITDVILNKVAAEFHAICTELQPERVHVLWADADVAKEQTFEQGELPVFEVAGGGGTDMRVPLKYMEQYEPQVVVLITDGHTPWPKEEPPYPLIVVCTTPGKHVPIGRVIYID
jgi:predicted metal-dependent peptidase